MTEAAPQGTPPAAEGGQANSEASEPLFVANTQKDLDKMFGNTREEGRTSAINSLLEKTGAESIDDVLSAYSEYQGIQERDQSEADKQAKRAEKLEARATAAEERYTNTLREYALRDSLRDAGINPERLKGAMRLADTSALEVDEEGNVTGLEEVVEAVQEEAPEWFGSQERQRVSAPQTNGTGVSTPANQTDPQTSYANWLAGILEQA